MLYKGHCPYGPQWVENGCVRVIVRILSRWLRMVRPCIFWPGCGNRWYLGASAPQAIPHGPTVGLLLIQSSMNKVHFLRWEEIRWEVGTFLAKLTIIFSGKGDLLRFLLGCQLSLNESYPGRVTSDRGSLRYHVPLMVHITQRFTFSLSLMAHWLQWLLVINATKSNWHNSQSHATPHNSKQFTNSTQLNKTLCKSCNLEQCAMHS